MIELIIYVTGIVPGYLMQKKAYSLFMGEWTVGMRGFTIFIALLSWVGFIVSIIQYFVVYMSENSSDKPAKW